MKEECRRYRGYIYYLLQDDTFALFETVDKVVYFNDESDLKDHINSLEDRN